MKGQLYLANQQRDYALNTRLLRAITRHLLERDAASAKLHKLVGI